MHPIFFIITEIILSILVVGFTSSNSVLRKIVLFPVLYCMVTCVSSCMEYMVRTPWASLLGGGAVTVLYQYIDIALINKWSFSLGRPTGSLAGVSSMAEYRMLPRNHDSNTIGNRLRFGLSINANYRLINTPYQIKNVPPLSTRNKGLFLWRKAGVIIVSYLLLDLINSSADPAISQKYFIPEKVTVFSRLHDITAEELFIRTFTALAAAISLNCVQGGIYSLFALLSVGTGSSTADDWPPFYGSLLEAYTLKRFWGIYWHQSNTKKYSSLAGFVVHDVCKVHRGTIIARYLRLITAFMSSGVMHLLIDSSAGIKLKDSGAIRFFFTQAVGVLIETRLVTLYRSIYGPNKGPQAIVKALGFLWVSMYLIWSTPSYLYPIMWRAIAGYNDSVIPYSIFTPEERGRATAGIGLVILFAFLTTSLGPSERNINGTNSGSMERGKPKR